MKITRRQLAKIIGEAITYSDSLSDLEPADVPAGAEIEQYSTGKY